MRRPTTLRRTALAVVAVCSSSLAACGTDDPVDAGAAEADVPVEVRARFATEQEVSDRQRLTIRVRNVGGRTIPDLAIVLGGLQRDAAGAAGTADPRRPVWIVDGAPGGAVSDVGGTWAVGPLPPGRTRTYRWRLTPATPGTHRLTYRVSGASGAEVGVRDARGGVQVRVGGAGR